MERHGLDSTPAAPKRWLNGGRAPGKTNARTVPHDERGRIPGVEAALDDNLPTAGGAHR